MEFIILHGADATAEAEGLQLQLIEVGVPSMTFSEVLLEGPLNIAELVASSTGIIFILTNGLLNDMVCLTMSKQAIKAQKGLPVVFENFTAPSWSSRPFRLMPGDMYEVDWEFFMTQIRSYTSIALMRESDDQELGDGDAGEIEDQVL